MSHSHKGLLNTHAVYAVIAAVMAEAIRRISTAASRNPVEQWILFGVLQAIFLGGLAAHYLKRWQVARPDEWQLLVRDGHLINAGVGACHFRSFFDQVVRFPSSIQKVEFRVEQVTQEMQGVVVSGFALWSVHREGDGPWKAYKNLVMRDEDSNGTIDSQAGNQYIRDTVQSIIRVAVAQQTLQECLTKRDEIRDTVRGQIMSQLTGWGVWLETVEITDVRVSSVALFKDLQAEFRAARRLAAERVTLASERQLLHEQLEADLVASKRRNETEANKAIDEVEQKLRKEKKELEFLASQAEVQKQRLEKQREMEIAELECRHAINKHKQQYEQSIEASNIEASVKADKLKDSRLAGISDRQLEIMRVEAAREIYGRIGKMNVNSFGGSGNDGLLPGLTALAHSWQVVQGGNTSSGEDGEPVHV